MEFNMGCQTQEHVSERGSTDQIASVHTTASFISTPPQARMTHRSVRGSTGLSGPTYGRVARWLSHWNGCLTERFETLGSLCADILPPSLPTRKTLRDDIMYTKHFSSPECVSYIHFPTLVWSPTCKLHLKIWFYLPPLFHHRNVWRSTVLFHRRGYGPNLVLGWSRYF